MKSIVKRVLAGDWTSIQSDVEKMAADKVKNLVDNKKIEVLAKLNDTNVDTQRDVMNF